MSADRGIYVLSTKDNTYRILETTAIDNLWTNPFSGSIEPSPNSVQIIKTFGKVKSTKNFKTAMYIAGSMLKNTKNYCEYGIQIIRVDKTWDDIISETAKVMASRKG